MWFNRYKWMFISTKWTQKMSIVCKLFCRYNYGLVSSGWTKLITYCIVLGNKSKINLEIAGAHEPPTWAAVNYVILSTCSMCVWGKIMRHMIPIFPNKYTPSNPVPVRPATPFIFPKRPHHCPVHAAYKRALNKWPGGWGGPFINVKWPLLHYKFVWPYKLLNSCETMRNVPTWKTLNFNCRWLWRWIQNRHARIMAMD